jgi:hypothetical protein
MTQLDILQFENYIRQSFSSRGLPLDRCSQVLFSQLAHMPNYGGMNYPYQFVEREIKHLEGLGDTTTKPEAPFRKNPLSGFMHNHFCVPGYEHLGINTKLAWKFGNPNPKKFSQMALSIVKRYVNSNQTDEDKRQCAGEIANEIVSGRGGVQDRLRGNATGDWIIYLPHKGKNYYLCIAKHDEDGFILEAIKHCTTDFPFINDVFAPN